MKNEIVTPGGAHGEAGCRRRLPAIAVRAALAGLCCAGAVAPKGGCPPRG
ncbi:hypothetical protein [Burkholderia catarinensis]|nr:hypothetical protein [Burkholderia catarinensis]